MNDIKANEITQKIEEITPDKLLLLGTSQGMALRITQRLGLPAPARIITIDEVASEKEIRKARFHRNKLSKHVIPAPTMEVERSLPGILADPLRIFLRKREKTGKKDWIEKSVIRPTRTYNGKLIISDSAINAIARLAAEQVDGITGAKRIKVIAEQDGTVQLEITPTVRFGSQMREVSRNVQQHVKEVLEYMTGLQVLKINIKINSLSVTQNTSN